MLHEKQRHIRLAADDDLSERLSLLLQQFVQPVGGGLDNAEAVAAVAGAEDEGVAREVHEGGLVLDLAAGEGEGEAFTLLGAGVLLLAADADDLAVCCGVG